MILYVYLLSILIMWSLLVVSVALELLAWLTLLIHHKNLHLFYIGKITSILQMKNLAMIQIMSLSVKMVRTLKTQSLILPKNLAWTCR